MRKTLQEEFELIRLSSWDLSWIGAHYEMYEEIGKGSVDLICALIVARNENNRKEFYRLKRLIETILNRKFR